ncbi:MAG: O-antigen ligase family protein [Anaerolineaceae bacterium]
MPKSWLERLNYILWGLLLLALPVTSFPLILRILGGNSVAPLSIVPLVLLTFTLLLPTIYKNKSLPKEVMPLMLFLGIAVISTAIGYFKDIPSFRETPVFRNALEGFLTLITGIAFFLTPIFMVRNEKDLRFTLRIIYIAFGVILIFCVLQAGTSLIFKEYPPFLFQIQNYFSSSGKIFVRRVYGLAFEPSWLAHQLNILFIPLFLAASYHGFTLSELKLFRKFNLEHTLLFASIAALFLSFSRIGWLTGILLLAYLLFRLVSQTIDRTEKPGNKSHRGRRVIIWFCLIVGLVGLMIGLGFILTKIDPRNAKLFDLERFKQFGFMGWASQLGVAERVIFWLSAYQVYLMHPLLGVGFGGAGYFFPQVLPDYGFRLPEIVKVLTTDTFIPNAKNLWVRLLAETGIVGFIVFLSWLYVVLKAAVGLEKKSKPDIYRFMGLFGKLALLALLIEGFSTDTFGLPYFWLVFGLVVAVARFEPIEVGSIQLEE